MSVNVSTTIIILIGIGISTRYMLQVSCYNLLVISDKLQATSNKLQVISCNLKVAATSNK